MRYHIGPLEPAEIDEYINHRLQVAGPSRVKFSDSAIDAISEFSCGTPRLINIICDRALLAGYVQEKEFIDTDIMNKCFEELGNYSIQF